MYSSSKKKGEKKKHERLGTHFVLFVECIYIIDSLIPRKQNTLI